MTALREWEPLAKQGNASAQTSVGVMYANGRGVPQDYKTSVKWYRLGAEQGFAFAQTNFGFMYEQGQGVLQDYVRAHMWFNIAESSRKSKKASKHRDNIGKKMTPADISAAQKLARECFLKKYQGC